MSFSTINALSPLDGRYAARLDALRPLMSEQGYMQRRVQVEVAWFVALSDAGFAEFKPLSSGARSYLISLVTNFSEADALAIKAIEKVTNHDVKAVEYWLKSKFEARTELLAAAEFVHFACTSEDINNTSHALQLKSSREQVLLPAIDKLISQLRDMAHQFADEPMLSRRRQGNCQRGGTSGASARKNRRSQNHGQNERRGRQLQRTPVSLAGL
jgi:adenylosuccinate lyase